MNFKNGIVGGVSTLGGGTTVGGAYFAYAQPGTVGSVLEEGGYFLMPLSKSKKDKTLWSLVILRYSEEKNEEKRFKDFEIKDLGVGVVDSRRGKLEKLCKDLLNTKLTGNNNVDDKNIEKATRWCVAPDEVSAGVFLNYNKTPVIFEVDSSKKEDYWKKAYDRFFVESDSGDEIGDLKGKEKRESGDYDDKDYEKLKTGCETLLRKSGVDNNKDNQEKASKWCVLFTSVEEGKTVDDSSSESNWKSKYDESASDSTLKTTIEKFKSKVNNGGGEDKKKAEAMKKWCKIAINASDRSKAKTDKCILKSVKKPNGS